MAGMSHPGARDPGWGPAGRGGPAGRDPPRRRAPPRGLDARPAVPVVVLVVAYGISRVWAAVAGVRYDDVVLHGTPLTDKWQLLDVHLLRTDLVDSVWHLNSQPPLFNLYCGLLLKLPTGLRRPTEVGRGAGPRPRHGRVRLPGPGGAGRAPGGRPRRDARRGRGLPRATSCTRTGSTTPTRPPPSERSAPGASCGSCAPARARFGFGFFVAYAAVVLTDSTYQVAWLAARRRARGRRAAAAVAHRARGGRRAPPRRRRLVREGLRAGGHDHHQQLAGHEPGQVGPLHGARRPGGRAAAPGPDERTGLDPVVRRSRGLRPALREGRTQPRRRRRSPLQVRRGHQLQQPPVRARLVPLPP